MNEEISLSALYHRALTSATRATNLSVIEDETQKLVVSVLSDLRLVRSRVQALSLFSPNETAVDISSRNLVYLFVPFVLAEMENRVRTTGTVDRLERISRAQTYLREFITLLETYQIVPEKEKELLSQRTSSVTDPSKRRELKIKQYQKEKELRMKIETIQKRRHQPTVGAEIGTDFELIASLLPTSTSSRETADEDDSETEDILRETVLMLLLLLYGQTHASLESMDQELELLRNMPSLPPRDDTRTAKRKGQDDMWKLDVPRSTGGPDREGPLLDSSGKPMRPFTILPANTTDRARLQAQVFRPDHRLPTMTIDEYLEVERQRGNIISGGGPQSESKPTTSVQLQLDSEGDGTVFGEEKTEKKRQKDEKWAQYKDTHPRGAGNTINRG